MLTLTGEVRAGHVAAGLVFVVDNPTRQVFVNEVSCGWPRRCAGGWWGSTCSRSPAAPRSALR
ncbi:MAG TPA: hypothetical protein VK735_29120 [Pseudonocardia sp.]|uniref:hypothetical protein n=1 Tax=Pseudonocardia sp. TaxID=60912 RepID=UPI002C71E52D|nr:hypothetical protein [Pseudonocardia sp.]HTF51526.1 hypothetical protein [Pseudonocardia sp.]